MTLSVIFYPYHCVRAILSIPFCPMPFCPYTILSIPFCPCHFVRYHFVLEPTQALISSLSSDSILSFITSNSISCCGLKAVRGETGCVTTGDTSTIGKNLDECLLHLNFAHSLGIYL